MNHSSSGQDAGHQQPERLVRFGSLIHLNLEDSFQYYMYGEGFMNQSVEMKKFDLQGEANKDDDFSYCLFMILPFQDLNSFKQQQFLLEFFTEGAKELKKLGQEEKLDERRNRISDFKNRIESEFLYNINTMERQCGQKILLINSNFMLLHLNTMKYVCLNKENSENLYVELVEYPNSFCFFKFMPSLRLQTMRNDNFVYENELMHICCSEMIDGKRPYLIADVIHQQQNNKNQKQNQVAQTHLVYASIDSAKSWKLNLYQEPTSTSQVESIEEKNYLRAGDIVWIIQTEKKLFVSSQRQSDPFVEILNNQKNRHGIAMLEEDQVKLIKNQLLESFKTEFKNIENIFEDSEQIQKQNLSTNGLYRIEPENVFVGGPLQWGNKYRIRHLISGKYLSCYKQKKSSYSSDKARYQLKLTKQRDDSTLFKFIPIENLMFKFQSKQNIQKDSYFRIQHLCNDEIVWLSVKEEEQDDNNQSGAIAENLAIFEAKMKEVNTFKFRKSNQQDIWETNFLQSSIPLILSIAQNIVDISEQENFKNQMFKLSQFDFFYPKVIDTIKSIENFITNKIISNISMQHEYNYPSQDRQNKFCEQMLLGLFCWFLAKVFPKPEEFSEFNVKPGDEFLKDDSDPVKNGLVTKQFKGREKFYRQCVQHLKNKYILSYQIYSLIKFACYRNQNNQLYFFKFQNDFVEHIGYGDFVKEAFEFCFEGNFQILHSLHQIQFTKRSSNQNQNAFQKKSKSKNFFQYLVKKLKKMEPYTKNDILSLLASFCMFYHNSIYINQEKIFSSFIDNRQIIFNTLLKIREEIVDQPKDINLRKEDDSTGVKFFQKKKNFFIEIKRRQQKSLEYDIVTLNLTDFDKKSIQKNRQIGNYFLCQIELYSNMCANRNFTSGKAFSDIFPQNTLMEFIQNDNHSIELRARMCKLQRNLYIDKEPRLIIQKPNLVRIFISQDDRLNDREICPFIFDPVILKMIRQPKLKKKKENLVYLQHMKNKFERYLKKQEEAEIYIQFIKNNAKEDIEFIRKNQIFIRRELKKCFQAIMKLENMKIDEKNYPDYYKDKEYTKQKEQPFTQTSNQAIYDTVFNNLTYEVIKNFHLMLKYGFFTKFAQFSQDKDENKVPIKIFKDIVSYLSFILEFEIDYTSELIKNGASQVQSDGVGILKRKYISNIEKQIEEQKEGISLLSVKNIGGEGLKLFTDLTKVLPIKINEEEEEEEDGGVKGSSFEKENQSQLNFLNTYQSLQKLLTKFTDKTYQMKNMEIKINKDLETLIKIEICEIFEYLMDWREDFYIQNAMNYFTDVFYENNKADNNYQRNQDLEKELSQLFPENMFAVGQPVLKKKRKFKKLKPKKGQIYDPNLYSEQVGNIDDIIRRPFSESLMIGFYFSEDPDLQNKFANLIYRCFTQKKKLIENIFKINLVNSGSSDRSYQQMSKLISRLKALISYSQSWLQIIEQDTYNEKAEENLEITLNKLTKLYEQFNEGKSEDLEIKQKIFKHLEGHKVLLKFLEQGTSVLQTNSHYFTVQNQEIQKYSYKKVFMYSVINVFKTCHKILSIFCFKNQKIQKTLFKHYHKLLFNQSYLNIGQMEFICEIFRGNRDLSLANNTKYIDYTINLIKIHGMQPEFLELFWILMQNQTSDSYEIQKRIIQTLLDSKVVNIVNPFKADNLIEQKRATMQYLELMQSKQKIEESKPQSMLDMNENILDIRKTQKLLIVGFDQTKNIELKTQTEEANEANEEQLILETENSEVQQDLKNNFDINLTIKFYEQCQTQNPDVLEKRLREYKLKLIQIISIGFTTSEIGVNFIYRSFLHIRVPSLFQLLLEEMKIKQNKNINDKNANKQQVYSRKQYITDLLLTYFYKLDQSIAQFQQSSQIFIQCVEIEIQNIRNKYNYSQEEKQFMIDNFLPLINEYNDNFLKDSVLLAIQQKENSIESHNQKVIYSFAQNFLHEIYRFVDFSQYKKLDNRTTQKLKNIAILSNNFRINFNPPEILQQLINIMAVENQEVGGQYKDHTCLNKYNQPTRKHNSELFHKFKNCVNAIMFLKKAEHEAIQNGNKAVHFDQLKKLERESRYLKLWNTFKNLLKDTKSIKEMVKEEQRLFKDSIMNFENFIDNKKDAIEDLLISKEDIIKKLLNFINFWKEMGSSKGSVIFIIKTLRHIIERSDTPNSKEPQLQNIEDDNAAKEKRQNVMDALNTSIVCSSLLTRESQKDKVYLYYLFRLLISLLDGGNKQVQNTLYEFFISNSQSEYLFQRINNIIEDEIKIIKKLEGKKTSFGLDQASSKHLIENVLQLIQLLCEGHNNKMQSYLRNQFNSKVSYNLVERIIELLISIKISNETYVAVKQCFDTLTELVQGPCKQNQTEIIQSKFLEYAVDILREEESVYVTTQVFEKTEEQNNQKDAKKGPSKPTKVSTKKMIEQQESQSLAYLAQVVQNKQQPTHILVKKKQAHKGYISRIKHKCLITILSLLELNENDISTFNRIRRAIPLQVLINIIVDVFTKFKGIYKGEYYRECFNQQDLDKLINISKIEDENKYELVIELGFNAFILVNIFLSKIPKNQMDQEQLDTYQMIQELLTVQEDDEEENTLFTRLKELQNIATTIAGAGLNIVKQVGQTAVNLGGNNEKFEEEQEQLQLDFQQKKNEAIKFFTEKTITIELQRDNHLCKIYFPRMPFFSLPKEYKLYFHEDVDYNSDKGKLRTLIESSKELIHVMNHEEDCREFFRRYRIIGFIADHKTLWEDLAFCCNCLLNATIIASYGVYDYKQLQIQFECLNGVCDYKSELYNARMHEPRMFGYDSNTWTNTFLKLLGIINLVFSSLIFFFFFIKRAPILLKSMWLEWYEEDTGRTKKILKLLWTIVKTIYTCCTDFDFMYYTFYMAICIVGLVVHPFFFGFLTVDFLRIKILSNVVKAVWIPRVEIALTFMLFLLAQYYYSIITYLCFYDQYGTPDSPKWGTCDVYWRCIITNIDFTFKASGSIGGILIDESYNSDSSALQPKVDDGEYEIMNTRYLARFLFDNFFIISIVIVLINMVAGIIIENFSAFKDIQYEKEEALVSKCFVCGIERDNIEKAYDQLQYKHGFKHHIRHHHYMWDYVYFSAYLQYKDQKEFTGNESYVFEQLKTSDVSWFPVKRAIHVQDEETQIKLQRKQELQNIQDQCDNLQSKIESLRLKVSVVKSEIV
ncbi:MIR domain protein (macronuclear) [Tetrahymena thermophila SB210]|uniref:MIR domain protein n=1 Tax=Tetrahymena thermophila (strain SB210) TaxID=312017 RepID=I7MEA3_TETTS|nr:MIR domain protein [Tetrahymena thermophila SB210]EAR95948.2 MIR domain protein [Tetrahymena thermophila SB210]|eukprot:XP_001016193.2 MIR domain protein [Tetrahymena thermophila SB210]